MNTEKAVLVELCRYVVALLAEIDRLLSLHVAACDVVVELDWSESESEAEARAGAGRTAERGADVPARRFPSAPEGGAATAAGASQELTYITSPTVGVFYRSPEPGARPFVSEGDTVVAGQQVGIIEVMKLMIPVEADQPGRIVEVLHADGTSVECDERLYAVATTDRAAT
ncbi:hypothetical protein FDG2_4421 [Candidatus Protofrankia californiensis]|uniref:Biotin carboxyl carrier protein of acetyl-CoA carboxylase n=1 Tax=Candidatus Protofrankia californiensis TaxID=1839754 RepID=A0A1C3P5J8_9ACTN|nr:hypothetical protein FDG2_4421 [Candidatus Protofrankia californiensis]